MGPRKPTSNLLSSYFDHKAATKTEVKPQAAADDPVEFDEADSISVKEEEEDEGSTFETGSLTTGAGAVDGWDVPVDPDESGPSNQNPHDEDAKLDRSTTIDPREVGRIKLSNSPPRSEIDGLERQVQSNSITSYFNKRNKPGQVVLSRSDIPSSHRWPSLAGSGCSADLPQLHVSDSGELTHGHEDSRTNPIPSALDVQAIPAPENGFNLGGGSNASHGILRSPGAAWNVQQFEPLMSLEDDLTPQTSALRHGQHDSSSFSYGASQEHVSHHDFADPDYDYVDDSDARSTTLEYYPPVTVQDRVNANVDAGRGPYAGFPTTTWTIINNQPRRTWRTAAKKVKEASHGKRRSKLPRTGASKAAVTARIRKAFPTPKAAATAAKTPGKRSSTKVRTDPTRKGPRQPPATVAPSPLSSSVAQDDTKPAPVQTKPAAPQRSSKADDTTQEPRTGPQDMAPPPPPPPQPVASTEMPAINTPPVGPPRRFRLTWFGKPIVDRDIYE